MRRNRFGLELIVDGRALPEYEHIGKIYVPAPWGREFSLRLIVPDNSDRHEAVCSVDGLDILTGKTASTAARGYIMTRAAHSSDNDIRGFRLNDRDVARFRFGDRGDSYAAQMDKPRSIGVIAVVYYGEYIRQLRRSGGEESTGNGFECLGGGGGTRSKIAGHDMGTEFGRREEQRVSRTTFERDGEMARFTLEYASRESLIRAGVIREDDSPLGDVDPFPGDGGGCKPPKGWRG